MQEKTQPTASSQKTFAVNWSLMVTDKPTFIELQDLGRTSPGVVFLDPAGTAKFVKEEDLRASSQNPDSGAEAASILALFEKAKAVSRNPYDPATDIVFVLDPALAIVETLSTRQRVVATAWWARHSPRSIRRVNLDDTGDELLRFALG